MNKISLKKGILTVGLMMALSPAALFADNATTTAPAQPSNAELQAEIKKLEEEQQRLNSELRQQKAADPAQYKQIQDIPNPKDLGSD